MKSNKTSIVAALAFCLSGCGTAPLHGTLVSNEKNVWVEDAVSAGLRYCTSYNESGKIEPVCYPAKEYSPGESPNSTKAITK